MYNSIHDLAKISSDMSVLYIEDEKSIREQFVEVFNSLFKSVQSAENGKIALDEYNSNKYDLVITDLSMPEMNGTALIEEILKINPQQHVIVMTAHNTSENLRDSINFQVDGILLKPIVFDKLFHMLYKVCKTINLENREKAPSINSIDSQKAILDSYNNGDYAMFISVIDKFDDIVENFGMDIKDKIYEAIEENLSNFAIFEDSTLRIQRDAYAFIVKKKYLDNMLQIIQDFSEHNRSLMVYFEGSVIHISTSYGIVTSKQNKYDDDKALLQFLNNMVEKIREDERSTLIVKMDIDLEDAKKNDSLNWLNITQEALKQKSIIPFYQPVADINTMEFVSYEVFARIKQNNDYILPKFFIDLSEKAGILEDISEVIFKKSFEVFSNNDFSFHINITDAQWKNNALEQYLGYLNANYNIDHKRVVLNITNYELLNPDSKNYKRLLKLKSMGYQIALKHFGNGLINIDILTTLQPDYIKIDQLLIQKLLTDSRVKELVTFLISYTKSANIKSMVVGVENKELLDKAKELGIDYAQGYYISEPSETLKTYKE